MALVDSLSRVEARDGGFPMKCVIMQPTFFPWAGYFNLASHADVFVFLDDVQLEKQSWQTRNRILLQGKPVWISVPVLHRSVRQTIGETEVCDQYKWRGKLLRQLEQGYAKHPYSAQAIEVPGTLPHIGSTSLADINIALLREFCGRLGLAPKFARSSELGIAGERSERLIRICERFGCDEYLSPAGAADYLAADRFVDQTSIGLTFQRYVPMPYGQPRVGEFVSHLSIIDIVANLGWQAAAQYVRTSLPEA